MCRQDDKCFATTVYIKNNTIYNNKKCRFANTDNLVPYEADARYANPYEDGTVTTYVKDVTMLLLIWSRHHRTCWSTDRQPMRQRSSCAILSSRHSPSTSSQRTIHNIATSECREYQMTPIDACLRIKPQRGNFIHINFIQP